MLFYTLIEDFQARNTNSFEWNISWMIPEFGIDAWESFSYHSANQAQIQLRQDSSTQARRFLEDFTGQVHWASTGS